MPWTKLSSKGLFGFSTMLSHFNLCLVKTAKTAFETFHTPVNHCEICIGTLLHDRAPEYKFKCHKNVTSIHQAPQNKQK
jgi:hypothetical protein